jgi:hypothetical protein
MSAQRTRFQQRRPSERETGVCCKPELGGHAFAPFNEDHHRWLAADTMLRRMLRPLLVLASVTILLGCERPAQQPTPTVISAEPPKPMPVTEGVAFRRRLLEGDSSSFGISKPGPVWGVLMETADLGGTFSRLVLSDGHANVFASSGTLGTLVTLRLRDEARVPAAHLCVAAEKFLGRTTQFREVAYPTEGRTRFTLLTPSGARSVEVADTDLNRGEPAFSELASGVRDVMRASGLRMSP